MFYTERVGDALSLFTAPTAAWFRESFGAPTPPQAQGWPAIACGDHALIVSPTGSGKTLTAFLWSLDRLFQELRETPEPERRGRRSVQSRSDERGIYPPATVAKGAKAPWPSPGPPAAQPAGDPRQRVPGFVDVAGGRAASTNDDEAAPGGGSASGPHPPRAGVSNPALPEGEETDGADQGGVYEPGVRVVYVSPLKALNNDVERNLQRPLAGIRAAARVFGEELPDVRVAVRTGDTPGSERQAMVRTPPHVLITTPESLYLLLTSERARAMFGTVHTLIVDEIHTVVGSKRGAHLAVSMERLERLSRRHVQRIGLSATVRPLENAAHFLGGQDPAAGHAPRPVTVVDAAHKKALDLRVVTPVEDFRRAPGNSVWNAIVPEVNRLIESHRTTLVFCNNRRLAERTADRLNERRLLECTGLAEGKAPPRLADSGDLGMFAAGIGAEQLAAVGLEPIRAHHGSMSKVARLEMERDLKSGTLPALVATSSLELGIDIGDVDLVVQLQSPKSVASGLQRVGRSGHLVGQTSVGRIFPTHQEDVVEAAAVARAMLRGEIEATATPENPLDVLAQHVLAMVGTEEWAYDDLYTAVRGAYPFRNLGEGAFRSVVEMLSGRYPATVSRQLAARLSWDRVNNRLAALPGTRFLAVQSGGTIPDRGTYALVLADRKTKIGELDEEFVYETRPGDTFLLGSQVWRVGEIAEDRVIAEPAPGEIPRMPFWKGDYPWRPYDLGKRIGAFRRELAEMLAHLGKEELDALRDLRDDDPAPSRLVAFLRDECALDRNSLVHLVEYLRGQLEAVGQIATDRSIVVEVFDDALGDPRMVVHSPFGGRVNGPWGVALAAAVRERTGAEPQVTTNDDGILLRFADVEVAPPAQLVAQLTSQEARERLLADLPNSAVFGAQFRMNAARALLLPRQGGGKRTPLWLSRLRAKDLLQAVQRFPDFPIILETYRDCLRDVMDLDGLTEVLDGIQRGEIRVTVHETEFPSPVAAGLDYRMTMQYMYEYDAPRGEKQLAALSVDRSLLAELLQDGTLAELLKPAAVAEVTQRVERTAGDARARSAEELAQLLYEMGDLSDGEVAERAAGDGWREWLGTLAAAGRVRPWSPAAAQEGSGAHQLDVAREPVPRLPRPSEGQAAALPGGGGDEDILPARAQRWVAAERYAEYENVAWDPSPVLRRRLMHSGPTTAAALAARYGLDEQVVRDALAGLGGEVVGGTFQPGGGEQWLDRRTLEQMHRRTISLLRQEVRPVPFAAYAEFLRRWQHVETGEDVSLAQALQLLRGAAVPGVAWERDVLPARIPDFAGEALAERCQAGEVMWVADGGRDPRRARVRFFFRGEGGLFLPRSPADETIEQLGASARAVYDFLREEGAALLADICDGTALARSAAQQALVDLALAGVVTNDTMAGLHALLGYEPPAAERPGLRSSLEAQLAALRPERSGRPLSRHGWRDTRRHAREMAASRAGSAGAGGASAGSRRAWTGRWSLVHRPTLLGKPLPPSELTQRQARLLLARWGIATKACLEREADLFSWEAVYPVLAALELRGEVRRGYFVEGLPGLQFALPEAVERLREANGDRHGAADGGDDAVIVVLSAVDPAQLYGGDAGALRFARVASTAVALHAGEPVAVMEDGGAAVLAVPDHPALVPALRALSDWWAARGGGRLKVERWAGEQVLDSSGVPLLEAAGFVRDYSGMWWRADAVGSSGAPRASRNPPQVVAFQG